METDFVVILVTCGSKKEASEIVDTLLKKRLIACGNIISGIESKFWWKGKIDKAKEVLVILKTTRENFNKVEKDIKRIHSYKVPEIIALPLIAGNKEYLNWLKEETRT